MRLKEVTFLREYIKRPDNIVAYPHSRIPWPLVPSSDAVHFRNSVSEHECDDSDIESVTCLGNVVPDLAFPTLADLAPVPEAMIQEEQQKHNLLGQIRDFIETKIVKFC